MKIREIMTTDVGYCRPDAVLTNAAMIMWQRDCGVVPVVDDNKKVVGMITDRDICIALATKNQRASEIKVGEVIYGKVKSCSPEEDAETALRKMKKAQLRRLPVVNEDGVLVGILSISDLLRHAGKSGKKISRKKLFAAFQEISHFRPVKLHFLNVEEADENDEEESENDLDEAEDDNDSDGDSDDDHENSDAEDDSDDEDDEDETDSDSETNRINSEDENSTITAEDAENSPGVIL